MKPKFQKLCVSLFLFITSGCALLSIITDDSPEELDQKYRSAWASKPVSLLISKRYPNVTTTSATGARLLIYNRFETLAVKSTTANAILDPNYGSELSASVSKNFPKGIESLNSDFLKLTQTPPEKGKNRLYCSSYFEINQTSNLVENIFWMGNDCSPERL